MHPPNDALAPLARMIGREHALDVLHGEIRRCAQAIQPVVEYGMCLVTCADEFQGELRASFDRDVAQPLMSSLTLQQRRIFSVSNLGGRIEPGALRLASDHFTVRTAKQGAKLLLVEVAAHVGRTIEGPDVRFGMLDRFGVPSTCCGALNLLLEKPKAADAVRHPWFDQLSAFFGPQRLADLRADVGPLRLARCAIVHAVLQVESAIADLLREPPSTPTHVLIVAQVVVNQRGPDGALLVGYHHLFCDGEDVEFEGGASLRSWPTLLDLRVEQGHLRSDSLATDQRDDRRLVATPTPADFERRLAALGPIRAAVERALGQPGCLPDLARTRARVEHEVERGIPVELHARALTRGLIQRLAVAHPEFGLAASLLIADQGSERARALAEHFAQPLDKSSARRLLHDLEAQMPEIEAGTARALLEFLLRAR